MNKPLISSRLRPSQGVPTSRQTSPTRSRSSSRRRGQSPLRMNTIVSMGEFRDWLRVNRNWDRQAKTKVTNSHKILMKPFFHTKIPQIEVSKARISNSFQEDSQPR